MSGKTSFLFAIIATALIGVSQVGCRACGSNHDYDPPVQGCLCEAPTTACGCCNSKGQRHTTARKASALGGHVIDSEVVGNEVIISTTEVH